MHYEPKPSRHFSFYFQVTPHHTFQTLPTQRAPHTKCVPATIYVFYDLNLQTSLFFFVIYLSLYWLDQYGRINLLCRWDLEQEFHIT